MDVFKLARTAGMSLDKKYHWYVSAKTLAHFADLVAKAERERCAEICEDHFSSDGDWCAKQIRAQTWQDHA
jgi:hypothetical protein